MASKEELFIKEISDLAIDKCIKEGIIPSLIISMACLESGFGSSDLAKNCNNIFGLNQYHEKFTEKYGTYTMLAPQERNGHIIYQKEEFCVFNNYSESIDCMLAWINPVNRPKYAPIHNVENYNTACILISELGYATYSKYTEKLLSLIQRYNLSQYDKKYHESLHPVTPVDPEEKKEHYAVICGSFKYQDGAIRYSADLNRKGYNTIIKNYNGMYRVQCGVFEIRENAEKLIKSLNRSGYAAFIDIICL